MKYVIIISICCFTLVCSGVSEKKQEQYITESINEAPELYIDSKETATVVPSVEDTILQQLGGKLYFSNETPPTDPITVIATNHHYSTDNGQYLEYEFIVHSKNTPFHTPFTPENLDKSYKAYFVEDSDMPGWYNEGSEESYNESINKQKQIAKNRDIDDAINNYTGYWIYLRNYNNQFFISDDWAWLSSFHISNDIITHHYMDGPYPFVFEMFKEDKNGDFLIRTVGSESIERYELIDKKIKYI